MKGCWRLFIGALNTFFGGILLLVLVPLVAPWLLLLWLWRSLVLGILYMRWGHQVVGTASGMEAVWALESESARSVVSAAIVLKGRLSVTTARTLISQRLLDFKDEKGTYKIPRFRQLIRVALGVSVWMWEEGFSVGRHVRQLRVAGRSKILHDEDELLKEMSARANMPFINGHSQWEVLVAPLKHYYGPHTLSTLKISHDNLIGSYPNGQKLIDDEDEYDEYGSRNREWTAVVVRLHHALGDGRSLVGLMVQVLTDSTFPDLGGKIPIPHIPVMHPMTPSPVVARPWTNRGTRVAHLLWSLTQLPGVIWRLLKRGDASLLHGPCLEGDKHLVWSAPLPLGLLKLGRQQAGVSVNDILLTGISSAISRHMIMEGVDPPDKVMCVIPLDVSNNSRPGMLSNAISLVTTPLPTGQMSLISRLQVIHRRLMKVKTSPDMQVNYLSLDLMCNLLPGPLARVLLCTHGVTCTVSNMPGPQEQIRLFGHDVDDFMFWIPNKSRTGVGLSILSYRGWVRVGLNVDAALVPSRVKAQGLIDGVAEEVTLLLDVLAQPPASPVHHRRYHPKQQEDQLCKCQQRGGDKTKTEDAALLDTITDDVKRLDTISNRLDMIKYPLKLGDVEIEDELSYLISPNSEFVNLSFHEKLEYNILGNKDLPSCYLCQVKDECILRKLQTKDESCHSLQKEPCFNGIKKCSQNKEKEITEDMNSSIQESLITTKNPSRKKSSSENEEKNYQNFDSPTFLLLSDIAFKFCEGSSQRYAYILNMLFKTNSLICPEFPPEFVNSNYPSDFQDNLSNSSVAKIIEALMPIIKPRRKEKRHRSSRKFSINSISYSKKRKLKKSQGRFEKLSDSDFSEKEDFLFFKNHSLDHSGWFLDVKSKVLPKMSSAQSHGIEENLHFLNNNSTTYRPRSLSLDDVESIAYSSSDVLTSLSPVVLLESPTEKKLWENSWIELEEESEKSFQILDGSDVPDSDSSLEDIPCTTPSESPEILFERM